MNREEIEQWLKKYNVRNYTIRPNLVVDVDGYVELSGKHLTELPFQFGEVTEDFWCSDNQLTSLHNVPIIVGGGFYGHYNQLTSLQYCPIKIGTLFNCLRNPLEVTEENEGSWIGAIKIHRDVFEHADGPTEEMTRLHRLLWEV